MTANQKWFFSRRKITLELEILDYLKCSPTSRNHFCNILQALLSVIVLQYSLYSERQINSLAKVVLLRGQFFTPTAENNLVIHFSE